MSMNQNITSHMLADLLNIKPEPGTLLQRVKYDMKDHNNINMDDRRIILIKDDTLVNPFQNSFEEEQEPMIYQEQEPSSMPMIYQEPEPSSMPMIYQEPEPLTCKENKMSENELIMQQQELIRQQQELIRQQQEQLNKQENMITNFNHNNHSSTKKHKKTVRFQLIPFHKKMSKKKTRRATPLPQRSSLSSPKFLKL